MDRVVVMGAIDAAKGNIYGNAAREESRGKHVSTVLP